MAIRALALAAATTCAAVAVLVLRRRRRRRETHEKPLGPLPDFARLPRIGWRWVHWKTADENYLDLAYLLARNSEAKDGHMGCCVVRDGAVVATTINCGLFGDARSGVHAEAAAAVSDRAGARARAARRRVHLRDARALPALLQARGRRRRLPRRVADGPRDRGLRGPRATGMDVVKLRDTPDRARWRDDLAALHRDDDAIRAARERRKAAKRDKTYGKLRSGVQGGRGGRRREARVRPRRQGR
ncbi:cytidine and deoxycytidylate deaminase [Aureococcus anophagefferens]|uniref:Cytidine and deoxycytidylate deaminase n=1 Tax=Aureococcus anophagefferens TaxID=44056 RepID=A0ABR1GAL9_AURAN